MKNDLIAITLATLALIWLSGYGTLLEVTDKIKAMYRLVSLGVKFEFSTSIPVPFTYCGTAQEEKPNLTFISVVFSCPMIYYPFRSF